MLPIAIQAVVVFGFAVAAIGLGITSLGLWPGLPSPRGPVTLMFIGGALFALGFCWWELAPNLGARTLDRYGPTQKTESDIQRSQSTLSNYDQPTSEVDESHSSNDKLQPVPVQSAKLPLTVRDIFNRDFSDRFLSWSRDLHSATKFLMMFLPQKVDSFETSRALVADLSAIPSFRLSK